MAVGAYDRDILNRVYLRGLFTDTRLTPDQLTDMHPLRRTEKLPPTEGQKKKAQALAWDMLGKGLTQLNRQRRG